MRLSRFFIALLAVAFALPASAKDKKEKKSGDQRGIEIEVVPGALRFATTLFEANAGEKLAVMLTNTCIMQHNWVLTKPGQADAVMTLAMGMGPEGAGKNFVPESDQVQAATKIVNPGQSETVKFKVPETPGDYPYLCTFPGHGTIMRGIMRVKPEGEPLEKPTIEKIDRIKPVDALKLSEVNSQPMGTKEHPYLLRSFVPNPKLGPEVLTHHDKGLPTPAYDVSKGEDIEGKIIETIPGVPGGIAVSFGPQFAYAWDATECRLLYCWMGGFLDMTPYWGNGTGSGRRSRDYAPALAGTLIYKAAGPLPLQLGHGERPKFKGYKMISGNPEFSYEIAGTKLHEMIMPADPGTFMVHYRVENASAPVRLKFDSSIRPLISCEQGGWSGDTLEIPVDHADAFMLLVQFKPGETFKPDLKKGAVSEEP